MSNLKTQFQFLQRDWRKGLDASLTAGLFTASIITAIASQPVPTQQCEKVVVNYATTSGVCNMTPKLAELKLEENETTVVAQEVPEEEEVFIEEEPQETLTAAELNVPNWEKGCRSYNFTYMDYKAITCKSTPQYKVCNSEYAYTDPETKLRMYNGEYLVAIAQGYGYRPGDNIYIVFESGATATAIVGEMKATGDCDPNEKYQATDGSVIEFLVDDISSCEEFNSNKPAEFNERVISITEIIG